MSKENGYLSYNSYNNRFGIKKGENWLDSGLSCGTILEIFYHGKWETDRLELSSSDKWYLVFSKLKGEELENLKVRI